MSQPWKGPVLFLEWKTRGPAETQRKKGQPSLAGFFLLFKAESHSGPYWPGTHCVPGQSSTCGDLFASVVSSGIPGVFTALCQF